MCKTKPIPAGPGGTGLGGREANCAKQTQFGWSAGAPERELRKTKPICTRPEESVGQAGTPNAVCRVWEPDPPYEWAQLRQTNPIQADRTAGGRPGGRGECAKQSQFGQKSQVSSQRSRWSELQTSHFTLHTRPKAVRAKQSQFPPEQREGQVSCRKGVMVNRTCNRLRQNKANSSIADCGFWIADSGSLRPGASAGAGRLDKQTQLARANCAKQSQKAVAGWRIDHVKQTQFRPPWGPAARDTSEEVGRGRPTHEELIVRNKANSQRAGGRGGVGSRHREAATPIGSEYPACDFDLLFTICDL
jgi:hypothetical protein